MRTFKTYIKALISVVALLSILLLVVLGVAYILKAFTWVQL